MSDQSQSYTPPLLPLGTVLGGRYRLVEALVGVDDKAVSGGWLGVDQQLGERRVVVRIAAGADPDWVSSREAFGNVAAPLLDSFPLEKGSAVVWRLPNQAVKWDHESLSREQRASMVVSLYRAISLDTRATSWVSDAGLFSMPTALGARPWVIPAERLGHTPDSARAEDLNALAELTLSLLFGVIDPTDADALARLPTRVFEVLEPWLSDDAEERLAHALTPLELATALGVAETSDRVPVPTAAVSKSASTKNRVASARALAKRVTRRERIAFVVLLVLLALGYLGLFASGSNVESAVVARGPVAERPAIEVATAENAVERTEETQRAAEATEGSYRLTMPEPEFTQVQPSALVRSAQDAEICRDAVYDGPIPSLRGCGETLYAHEPRVHVFRDAEERLYLVEFYDRVDRPTSRSRFRYNSSGSLDQITTTSLAMATLSVLHVDIDAGVMESDPTYRLDSSPDCWRWTFTLNADGRYEERHCSERQAGPIRYEYLPNGYREVYNDSQVELTWNEQANERCTTWLGSTEHESCTEYGPETSLETNTRTLEGAQVVTWVERTEYASDGAAIRMRRFDDKGRPSTLSSYPAEVGYDYQCESGHPAAVCLTAITSEGQARLENGTYDTLVTLEDAFGNPVLVSSERDGEAVQTQPDFSYAHVLRTYDAGGRVTSLSYWDAERFAAASEGVHRYEWDYGSGPQPIEERLYDVTGELRAGRYNRVVWDRRAGEAPHAIRYFRGDVQQAIESLQRNDEGRVVSRCIEGELLGMGLTDVHCLEMEWVSFQQIRIWFRGPEATGSQPVFVNVRGPRATGVELQLSDNEVAFMRLLMPTDRGADTTSGDFDCRYGGGGCIGLAGFWLNGDEPGALARQ